MPDETVVWKIGARVQRHTDVYDTSSPLMHGWVTGRRFHGGDRRYVYKVRWDDQADEQEYYWWGIHAEMPRAVPRG